MGGSPIAFAQVYRIQTEDGNIIYSTKPEGAAVEPANLPSVGRENISQKIASIRQETPANCDAHGGIDCSLGQDGDGSVLCLDGHQDAVLRFADACTQVRLQAAIAVEFASAPETLPFDEVFDGDRIVEERAPQRLAVAVRNMSGVPAKNMAVEFNIPFVSRSAPANGPAEISAFGTEEYMLSLPELMDGRDAFRIAQSKIKITCDNCLQVRIKK